LQIAMDDEVAVGELDGSADLRKEVESVTESQLMVAGIPEDIVAFHVFQHDVGFTLFGFTAVEETGNAGVLEARQNLALLAEAFDGEGRFHAQADYFNRDVLLERIVITDGAIDGAHAAMAQSAGDAIGTEAPAAGRLVFGGGESLMPFIDGGGEGLMGVGVTGQEVVDLGAQVRAAGAGLVEVGGAFGLGKSDGGFEYLGDGVPILWVHRSVTFTG